MKKPKPRQWFVWDARKVSGFNKNDLIIGYIERKYDDTLNGTAIIDKRGYECPHGVSFSDYKGNIDKKFKGSIRFIDESEALAWLI